MMLLQTICFRCSKSGNSAGWTLDLSALSGIDILGFTPRMAKAFLI
jgi:hypothetical protein